MDEKEKEVALDGGHPVDGVWVTKVVAAGAEKGSAEEDGHPPRESRTPGRRSGACRSGRRSGTGTGKRDSEVEAAGTFRNDHNVVHARAK